MSALTPSLSCFYTQSESSCKNKTTIIFLWWNRCILVSWYGTYLPVARLSGVLLVWHPCRKLLSPFPKGGRGIEFTNAPKRGLWYSQKKSVLLLFQFLSVWHFLVVSTPQDRFGRWWTPIPKVSVETTNIPNPKVIVKRTNITNSESSVETTNKVLVKSRQKMRKT
jgi:hypothetical protein